MNEQDHQGRVIHQPAANPRSSLFKSWFLGRPLPSADASHQLIGKLVGLAVFASDALSSTAYATQEILLILAAAGGAAMGYAFPIALCIVGLLGILTLSYRQTINAYPSGGGAYIVSRDNLGILPAQVAGAALLTDYILTVSVSVSAGIAQVVSAFPGLNPYRTFLAVAAVFVIMTINLRGVKESGMIFAVPTYFFLLMISFTILRGLAQYFSGNLAQVIEPPALDISVLEPISAFLLLHAFSSGTTALTGVEAISNGVTAFKEPRSKNAGQTLTYMALILGSLFLGITFLSGAVGAVPSEGETVISQLARTIHAGRGTLYLAVIGSTTLILAMAANTAFADFPRLSALQAEDRYLPRQLTHRGSRLVYSWGIITLSVISSIIIMIFKASVSSLIPLYAIGVFLSFTLSQLGMARRWWKISQLKDNQEIQEKGSTLRYESGWSWKLVLNLTGAIGTAVVMLIFAFTKFRDGAWIVLILIPFLVSLFLAINRHYRQLAAKLSLDMYQPEPEIEKQHVILAISGVHRGSLSALRYAHSIGGSITAVYVSENEEQTEKVQQRWAELAQEIPLVIIDSPYRELIHPLVSYIEEIAQHRKSTEVITVVVPEFVPHRWWQNLLHMQNATWLRYALRNLPGVVVVDVPYQVD